MNEKKLGRLERVDLSEIWQSEAGEFTPWLAQNENLLILADTLGLELECQGQEQHVGPFRADIVCKNLSDGALVLIENQLAKTDHAHLGQLMTYAAGLDAVTIVWIAEHFREEHRAAFDWLNEITGEQVSFFGLEIDLWRIGESLAAPHFNIVSKPNDWTKEGGGDGGGELSETRQLQYEYWRGLREVLAERKSNLKASKAHAQHWLSVSIGRSGFSLSALVNTQDDRIGVELYLVGPDAKKHFKRLEGQKAEIEAAFGQALDWRELPGKKACRIVCFKPDSIIQDRTAWPKLHQWHAELLERMDKAFRDKVQALPVNYPGESEVGS